MTTIPIPPDAIEAAAEAIRPWFNYFAPGGLQPSHAERVEGAAHVALLAALSVGEVREQRDCPGEDCRRHRFGQHKLIRTVVTWPDGTVITTPLARS